MARQFILAGFPQPIFVNETDSLEYALPGVYVNETSSTPVTGILALTQGAATLLATGVALIRGILTQTQGAQTIIADGTVVTPSVGTSEYLYFARRRLRR